MVVRERPSCPKIEAVCSITNSASGFKFVLVVIQGPYVSCPVPIVVRELLC